MPQVGFEPTISAGERPQTYALDRAAIWNGNNNNNNNNNNNFIINLSSGPQSEHSLQLLAYRLNPNPTQVTQSPARS